MELRVGFPDRGSIVSGLEKGDQFLLVNGRRGLGSGALRYLSQRGFILLQAGSFA